MAEQNVPIDVEIILKQKAELDENLKKINDMKKNANKKYYENNKDDYVQRGNERLKRLKETNPDKIKEYSRRAYLKAKEKKQREKAKNEQNENI
jgi:hypothetical protein